MRFFLPPSKPPDRSVGIPLNVSVVGSVDLAEYGVDVGPVPPPSKRVHCHTDHIEVRVLEKFMEGLPRLRGATDTEGLCQPVTLRDVSALQHASVGRKTRNVDPVAKDVFKGRDPGVEVFGCHHACELFRVARVLYGEAAEGEPEAKERHRPEDAGLDRPGDAWEEEAGQSVPRPVGAGIEKEGPNEEYGDQGETSKESVRVRTGFNPCERIGRVAEEIVDRRREKQSVVPVE